MNDSGWTSGNIGLDGFGITTNNNSATICRSVYVNGQMIEHDNVTTNTLSDSSMYFNIASDGTNSGATNVGSIWIGDEYAQPVGPAIKEIIKVVDKDGNIIEKYENGIKVPVADGEKIWTELYQCEKQEDQEEEIEDKHRYIELGDDDNDDDDHE